MLCVHFECFNFCTLKFLDNFVFLVFLVFSVFLNFCFFVLCSLFFCSTAFLFEFWFNYRDGKSLGKNRVWVLFICLFWMFACLFILLACLFLVRSPDKVLVSSIVIQQPA